MEELGEILPAEICLSWSGSLEYWNGSSEIVSVEDEIGTSFSLDVSRR